MLRSNNKVFTKLNFEYDLRMSN